MNPAELLARLFVGRQLTIDQQTILTMALEWRPWWPDIGTVARALRTGRPVDWPFPHAAPYVGEALEVLRPVYEEWLRSKSH